MHLERQGVPLAQILVMEALYTVAKLGLAGKLPAHPRATTDRFAQFVADHADVWR
ncbi:MAG: hypothetical protein HC933_15995 [Pleurocapsa sp. SU_196_0]|nr:hypothetical protein [Pleurocapsa sp. SU_196_0]